MEKPSFLFLRFFTFFILVINFVFISCHQTCDSTIGNGADIILAFSTGAQHVTIVYGYNTSSNLVKRIDMISITTFKPVTLINNLNLNVT